MNWSRRWWVGGIAALLGGLPQQSVAQTGPVATKRPSGLYATIVTTKGKIVCQLFEKDAPKTVKNFVGLAMGQKSWTDPKTGQQVKRKLYNGLTFHRMIPTFMIQGGDPLGTGTGGPGYRFEDEFSPSLKFDRPGRVAMANAGPNTNGSQFFITVAPTPWLDQHHTIFGQVVEGMEVVTAISEVARDAQDRPVEPVIMKQVSIQRVGGTPGKKPTRKSKSKK
ncbi:MAG: peptidylprolyl isomerase [Elusimicrobia bacterium]|nr:peptidylprolyl isomerase [Elusimicrobiota bacterium]